jgi:hypothetical protein
MLLATLLAASGVAAQGNIFAGGPINDIRVSVDNVVQCEQATISWSGNSGAVDIKIGLGGYYVGTNWIAEIAGQTGSSATWTVNQEAGSGTLIFQVTDTTGAFNYVQNIAIENSDKTSCLPGGDHGGGRPKTTSTSSAPEPTSESSSDSSTSESSSSSSSSSSDDTSGTTSTPAPADTQESTGESNQGATGQDQNTVSPSPSSEGVKPSSAVTSTAPAAAETQPSPNPVNGNSGSGAVAGASTSTVVVDASAPAPISSGTAAAPSSATSVSVARPVANASASPGSTDSGAQRATVAVGAVFAAVAALVAAQ